MNAALQPRRSSLVSVSAAGDNGGGPATKAELANPVGVAVDASGNLLIADPRNGRVRVVADSTGTFYGQAMTSGDIYTIAGNGQQGIFRPGRLLRERPARHQGPDDLPGAVAAGIDGNLVIGNGTGGRVRMVAGTSGTYYGRSMRAGDIYTIPGTSRGGYSGDGGPATAPNSTSPAIWR
jgi:NHL repeat